MHDNLRHCSLFATQATLLECFWWPQVAADIAWYIYLCYICQVHQTTKVLILPTVAIPAALFSKIYINMMFMPLSNNLKYIIQDKCLLIYYPKFCMLTRENTDAIAKWIFEDITCH